MTLHDAIIEVLKGNTSLSTGEIAIRINRARLYTRGDGKPVPTSQISARVNNYPELFIKTNGRISLSRFSPKSNAGEQNKPAVSINREKEIPAGELNFQLVGTMEDLINNGLPRYDWLNFCGVYRIKVPENYTFEIEDLPEVRRRKNVIYPWTDDRLIEKWVHGTDIIYNGLAGRTSFRTLRSRLGDLIRHCKGLTSSSGPHKGGEIIWQLKNYTRFIVYAAPTGDPPVPRDTEIRMNNEFIEKYGKLPFGNRVL